MSEYQYYEFLAIDRPLTDQQLRELRAVSTRAEITPTRFTNHYEWGDLKADPARWMERYFDAFLYVANWGTQRRTSPRNARAARPKGVPPRTPGGAPPRRRPATPAWTRSRRAKTRRGARSTS
ncbi:MAG TPA: hypothetical protein VFQ38_24830 [Longimicrobiales bacterium]|nr:hypothetical protein [Longimicrobiales bacterium]